MKQLLVFRANLFHKFEFTPQSTTDTMPVSILRDLVAVTEYLCDIQLPQQYLRLAAVEK